MGQHDVSTFKPHLVLAAPVLHKAELPPALYDCKHANAIQDLLKGNCSGAAVQGMEGAGQNGYGLAAAETYIQLREATTPTHSQ